MFDWDLAAWTLVLWALASLALARRAEARISGHRLPAPWCAIAGVVFVTAVSLTQRESPARAAACGLACIGLIVAADSDARTGYLFDAVTFPAALLSIGMAAICGATFDAACGVALLTGSFAAVVIVSKGRLIGLGDVKAMFAIGAAFGPLESLLAIFAASVCGIAHAALAGRLQRGVSLRFGPHLAAGSAFTLVAGEHIVHRWMGL